MSQASCYTIESIKDSLKKYKLQKDAEVPKISTLLEYHEQLLLTDLDRLDRIDIFHTSYTKMRTDKNNLVDDKTPTLEFKTGYVNNTEDAKDRLDQSSLMNNSEPLVDNPVIDESLNKEENNIEYELSFELNKYRHNISDSSKIKNNSTLSYLEIPKTINNQDFIEKTETSQNIKTSFNNDLNIELFLNDLSNNYKKLNESVKVDHNEAQALEVLMGSCKEDLKF